MSWDIYSKLLLKECPQDFVSYFVPGARFLRFRESQFQTRGDSPFQSREMRGDLMVEAAYEHQHFLMHVEWQSSKDDEMDMRLLGYCYEAMRLHKLPVLSIVIYLQSVSGVPRAPLTRMIPSGRQVIWFDFDSLEICERSVESLRRHNLDGFLPLLLLCKDGATDEVLDEVLERLQKRERKEMLSIAHFFAGKVFTSYGDQERIERRFTMLREFLEDSWTFQKTIEEGRARGLAEGRTQGRVEEARRTIEGLTVERFPAQFSWVREQIEQVSDLEILRSILRAVALATTAEEVRQFFAVLR